MFFTGISVVCITTVVVASGSLTVLVFNVVASVSAFVVVVVVVAMVAVVFVVVSPGLEIFTLLLGFLVVVISAKDLNGSNDGFLAVALVNGAR